MIKRLVETFAFFKTFISDIVRFLLYTTLPILVVETWLSYHVANAEPEGIIGYAPFLIRFLYKPIYTGGFIYLISILVSESNWEIKGCLMVGLRNWQNLIIIYVVSSLIIVAGIVAFIIPGLIMFARLSLSEFFVVLERTNPKEAMLKSFKWSKPFTWEIIGCTFLLSIMFLIANLFLQLLGNAASLNPQVIFFLTAMLGIFLESMVNILLFRFYDLAIKAQRRLDICLSEA